MSEEKQTKVGKFLRSGLVTKVVAPLLRGAIKQVPIFGTPIVEVAENLLKPKTMIIPAILHAQGIDGTVEIIKPNKHSYVSIATQIVTGICILYAFYIKAITIQDLVTLIHQVVGE